MAWQEGYEAGKADREQEIKDLKELNEEHRKLNGELRLLLKKQEGSHV
jgi:hypothetical protein